MPQYRANVTAFADGGLLRDAFVNTLHFNDHGITTDPSGLAGDLADAFLANWYSAPGAGRKINVKFYDMADAEPRIPKADVTRDGSAFGSEVPREVALCLSFYATVNRPRNRGRIYLPMAGIASAVGLRPNPAHLNSALNLAQAFADLGGADVDWIVRSTLGDASQPVTDAWCDDEFDTVRRRGLRATTRQTRHTGS